MANIPNSSRYRTTGRSNSAQGTAAPMASSWSAHQTFGNASGSNYGATGSNQPHYQGGSWPWIIAFLAVLFAFPVQTLSVLALLAIGKWFIAKN